MARQKNLNSRRAEQDHFRAHVRNVAVPTARLSSALERRRGGERGGGGGQASRGSPSLFEGTEPVRREPAELDPRHGGVNKVRYSPSMDFILRRLGAGSSDDDYGGEEDEGSLPGGGQGALNY